MWDGVGMINALDMETIGEIGDPLTIAIHENVHFTCLLCQLGRCTNWCWSLRIIPATCPLMLETYVRPEPSHCRR